VAIAVETGSILPAGTRSRNGSLAPLGMPASDAPLAQDVEPDRPCIVVRTQRSVPRLSVQ
jgi:hypothetical protein